MSSEPTEAELLRRAIENRLLDVHTSIPAVVERYYQESQTIDARVCLKRAIAKDDVETRHEEIPILRNIPVMFPRGGGFCLTFPLQKDDPVRLVFDEQYAGQYRDTGVVPSESGFVGRFNLSSCVAFPAGGDNSIVLKAVATFMIIGTEGPPIAGDDVSPPAQIHIKTGEVGDLIYLGPDITSRVALANLVAAKIQALVDAINAVVPAPATVTDAGETGLLALQAALVSFSATETNLGADRVYAQ